MLAAWAGPRAEAQAVPCDQALAEAEEHYQVSDFEATEDLVLACMDGAARADVLRGHRLLALALIRQGRMTEAQLAVLRILAVDYGYQPDVEIDPPFYVALVSTVRDQLRVEPGQGRAPSARTEQVATRPPPARTPPVRSAPAPSRPDSPSTDPPVRNGADEDPVVDRGRIDVNTASAEDLQSISGIGPALADRIVAYRTQYGAFRRLEDLENVRGIGPKAVLQIVPQIRFGDRVVAGAPAPKPVAAAVPTGPRLDLNTATAEELEALPAIGPALAGRILAYRETRGRFRSVDELLEVRGIGPRVLERFAPLVAVE